MRMLGPSSLTVFVSVRLTNLAYVSYERGFIELFGFLSLLPALVCASMAFVQQLQHADFAVGFNNRLPASLRFDREQFLLPRQLLFASFQYQLVALCFEQPIHVEVALGDRVALHVA
jgi:hypothetical protein